MNNVYVIILNWNNLYDTVECVNSLKDSSTSVSKIIIVDNGSSDNSGRLLKDKYENEGSIEFIINDKNEGFSRGINLGVIKAMKENPDYILLLNNDAFLDVNCINNLLKAFNANKKCGVAGPRIFYSQKRDIVWQGGGQFNYWTGGNVVPEKNQVPKVFRDEFVDATFLTGCIMLIKREVFEKIGLLDDDIFFYEEDVDFCLRAAKAGFKLSYVPSAVAWHKVEGIRTTPFAFYNRARSRIIVLRKNFNIIYVWYGILLHIILFTPYKIYQSIKSETPLETLVAWFKGSIDGVSSKLHNKETSLSKK